jgi:Rhodopirellula transposase DDE domain
VVVPPGPGALPAGAEAADYRRVRGQPGEAPPAVENCPAAVCWRGSADAAPYPPLSPGTSKWNKSEQRLFCFITQNWRGRPLLSRATVVNVIASTTTRQGLTVQAMLDERPYETGKQVTEAELAALKLKPEAFQGEWNYRLLPRTQSC